MFYVSEDKLVTFKNPISLMLSIVITKASVIYCLGFGPIGESFSESWPIVRFKTRVNSNISTDKDNSASGCWWTEKFVSLISVLVY